MYKLDSVLTKFVYLDRISTMQQVITIHEAKTHLSRYIKQAQTGEPVYIGGYGKAEVMLVPASQQKTALKIGLWKDKPIGYKDEDIVGSDSEIVKDFEDSINRPFTE